MKFLQRIRKIGTSLDERFEGMVRNRRIDVYSKKYWLGIFLFLELLFLFFPFCFQTMYDVLFAMWQAAVQHQSVNLLFYPFVRLLIMFAIGFVVYTLLVLVKKVKYNTLVNATTIQTINQIPRILSSGKYVEKAKELLNISLLLSVLSAYLSPVYMFSRSDLTTQIIISISCTFFALGFDVAFYIALNDLKLSSIWRAYFGLYYLFATTIEEESGQGKDENHLLTLRYSMRSIAEEIVNGFHGFFLDDWGFAGHINFWPLFDTIFLGLSCGNKEEKTATVTFLGELLEMLHKAKTPESFRQIIESLDKFRSKRKSLGALGEMAMLKGQPGIVRPLLVRVRGYEPLIATLGVAVAVATLIVEIAFLGIFR